MRFAKSEDSKLMYFFVRSWMVSSVRVPGSRKGLWEIVCPDQWITSKLINPLG